MLKVLIVEDETLDVAYILKNIDWSTLGLEVVGVTDNGLDAEKLEEQLRPDIIITDIIIPGINGTELALRIRKKRPNIKMVFMSGHQVFDYAISGIRASIEDYLIKPIEPEELTGRLKKIAAICMKEKESEFEREYMENILRNQLPTLRESLLREIVLGDSGSNPCIKEQLDFCSIELPVEASYCILLMQPDALDITEYTEKERQILRFKVARIIEEKLPPKYCNYFNLGFGLEFVVVLRMNENAPMPDDLAEELQKNISAACAVSFSIGVGIQGHGIESLKASYKCAKTALENQFFGGKGQVIHFKDISDNEKNSYGSFFTDFSDERKAIILTVTRGHIEAMKNLTEPFYEKISTSGVSPEIARIMCIELISSALSKINEINKKVADRIVTKGNPFEHLLQSSSMQNMKKCVDETLAGFCREMTCDEENRQQWLVDAIKNIIRRDISKNISVKQIANQLYVSHGYATRVFKSITGEGINRFIISERMNLACNLLANPDMKISDVMQEVGYNDLSYFSSVFKNEIGVSPRSYRDRLFENPSEVDERDKN